MIASSFGVAHAVHYVGNMKLARTHLGSLLAISSILAGVTAVACSAPPPGAIGAADQDQTDGDDDGKLPTSSTSPTNPSNPNGGTQPTTNEPGTTPTPAPAPPGVDASTPPADAGQCSSTADAWACFDCCDAAHPGGWEVAAQAFDQCVCTQACASVCGSNYCAGGEPSDACIQCLDGSAQQCEAAVDAACAGNASCAAADACAAASQCETKPDQ